MYSIISTLDPEAASRVKQLRAWFISQNTALQGMLLLEPHLSWLGVENLDVHEVGERLTQMAQTLSPLHLETTGFGVFTGSSPVLYLPVIKTEGLARLHARLWDGVSSAGKFSNLMYRPEQWLPHISVIYFSEDESESLGCALAELLKKEISLHFTIDHFKIAFFKGEKYGEQSIHRFKG